MSRKIGKTADSIFAPTTPVLAPTPVVPSPTPAVAVETRTKVTVVLYDRQIALLDHLSADMRTKTKAAVSRAEIIRALIDALAESGLDVTDATTEADIKQAVLAKMTD